MSRNQPIVRISGLALLAAAATGSLGHAQVERWRRTAQEVYEHGPARGMARVGDVDGDQIRELVTHWTKKYPDGTTERMLAVLSGADLEPLAFITPSALVGANSSFELANAGDVDGDGIDDLAVGAPEDGDGRVDLLSIPSGRTVWSIRGSDPLGQFGTSLVGIGDANGDAIPDLAIVAPRAGTGTPPSGRLTVVSGADGAILREWTPSFGHISIDTISPIRLTATPDRDGDGTCELHLIVTHLGGSFDHIVTLSGATATEIGRFKAPEYCTGFGEFDDFDGDGLADLVAGNIYSVDIISGVDGQVLSQVTTSTFSLWPDLLLVPDLDGDGWSECCITGSNFLLPWWIEVRSARTGELFFSAEEDRTQPRAVVMDDANRDGDAEVAVYGLDVDQLGDAVQLLEAADGKRLAESVWSEAYDSFDGGITFIEDLDSDGRAEVACYRNSSGQGTEPRPLVVLSSRDGAILSAFEGPYGLASPGGPIVAVPDIDGDGRAELVTGNYSFPATTPVVEVRSGATGGVITSIRSIYSSWVASGFGSAIAAGIDPTSGALQIGVGEPLISRGVKGVTGRFEVFALDGTLIRRVEGVAANDRFGASTAWIGDIDGDGSADWAVGAPNVDTTRTDVGRVSLLSGATGAVLRDLTGTFAAGHFGATLCAVPDADGDGLDDLLVGEPEGGPSREGRVYLCSTADGALLATWKGPHSNGAFGRAVGLLPDANHDGADEVLIAPGSDYGVDGFSISHGRLLLDTDASLPFSGVTRVAFHDRRLAEAGAPPRRDQLVFGSGFGGTSQGSLLCYDLGDLFLDVEPAAPAPADPITAFVRGGPAGSFAGLYVARIDDLSFDRFLLFGALDTFGEWTAADVTPDGLAGLTYSLRAYAVGFDGKLAQSTDVELTFQ